MTTVPETRYAPTAGGRIAYQVVGDGPVDLIVVKVAQLPVDLMWDEPHAVAFLERLSSFSRQVWFDLRGSGASDPVPWVEGRMAESVVEDMISVLDHLGWAEAAVLATVPEPVLFAASHPERTKSLVLCQPSARFRWAEDYPCGIPERELNEMLAEIRNQWGVSTWLSRLAPSLSDDANFQRWLGRCERLSAPPSQGPLLREIASQLDIRDIVPIIRVPTLVVATATGGRRALARSRHVADNIRGSKFVEAPGDAFFFSNPALLDPIEEFLTGRLPVHDSDRVLATVLFTDMVASTGRLADLGDRAGGALIQDFRAVVRAELERHRGREINTRGDDFLAVFDGPARAVRCALAIDQSARRLGVQVRSGIHTGEIQLLSDDVGGIAVHIGARVAEMAEASEVLVSRTVVDLVVGSGIDFDDRGEHELKGVPGTWRLFSVTG